MLALSGEQQSDRRPLESQVELIASVGIGSVGVVRVEHRETIAAVMKVVATDTKREVSARCRVGRPALAELELV